MHDFRAVCRRFSRRQDNPGACIIADDVPTAHVLQSDINSSPFELKTFTWKSLLVSVGLALLAGVTACAVWRAGLIDSIAAAFVVNVARGDAPLQSPQTWLALLLIVTISACAGFFVGRVGARRSFFILGLGFVAMCIASLLVSRYLKIGRAHV